MSITDNNLHGHNLHGHNLHGHDIQGEGDLPYVVSRASSRRFSQTVLFVHHFGGNHKTPHHHIELVNELGFDAVSSDLYFHDARLKFGEVPITRKLRFGARHMWDQQITALLDRLPGQKIVYCFSMPSNSAFTAVARRRARDVDAIVSDGGPFLDLATSVWNLLTHVFRVPTSPLRAATTLAALGFAGPGLERELSVLMARLPDGFPVLSFRGQKDPLVSVSAIERFFATAPKLALERFAIGDGGHLDGIKKAPGLYRERLREFLERQGTPT